jgi:hypothetical protein
MLRSVDGAAADRTPAWYMRILSVHRSCVVGLSTYVSVDRGALVNL